MTWRTVTFNKPLFFIINLSKLGGNHSDLIQHMWQDCTTSPSSLRAPRPPSRGVSLVGRSSSGPPLQKGFGEPRQHGRAKQKQFDSQVVSFGCGASGAGGSRSRCFYFSRRSRSRVLHEPYVTPKGSLRSNRLDIGTVLHSVTGVSYQFGGEIAPLKKKTQ